MLRKSFKLLVLCLSVLVLGASQARAAENSGLASDGSLAEVTRVQGDLHAALAHFEQSLLLYRQVGDISAAASVMGHIATIQLQDRKYDQAHELYATSYNLAQGLGSKPGMRQMLNSLGNVARAQGDGNTAKHYFRQSLALAAQMHNHGHVTLGLFALATVLWANAQEEYAATLLAASMAIKEREQLTLDPDDSEACVRLTAVVRTKLDTPLFARV